MKTKTPRWLAMAHRAAGFQTLVESAAMEVSRREADTCEQALLQGRAFTQQAHSTWRAEAAATHFHVTSDALHRRYRAHLLTREQGLGAASERADGELQQARGVLELSLARRDGLQQSLAAAGRRWREALDRQAFKEADDTWNVLNYRCTDEDR